jgi:hypothetical protein
MHSVYVVELRVTVPYLYIQILSFAQQCSYDIRVVSNEKTYTIFHTKCPMLH